MPDHSPAQRVAHDRREQRVDPLDCRGPDSGDAVTRPIPPDSADRARTEWVAWQLEQAERMA